MIYFSKEKKKEIGINVDYKKICFSIPKIFIVNVNIVFTYPKYLSQ